MDAMGQASLFDDVTDVDGEKPKSNYEKAQEYFARNPYFLSSIMRAAKVMESRCGKVSARFLVEFARWLRFIGWSGMEELLGCFSGIRVDGEDVAAIPNAYSAYLTRVLEAEGIKVTKAKSEMDHE